MAHFRRARFGDRPACPHCRATRIQRWGSFSGRRRYRCTACHRTFSDFTGTPMANLKHVDRWPGFCRCVLASLTVRQSARLLGVNTSTAFRWRHRLLRAMDTSDTGPLGATVLIHETAFPYSEKGQRGLQRAPRLRGGFGRPDVPLAWVIVAGDERRRMATGVTGLRRPETDDLTAALGPRLAATQVLVSTIGPFGAAGTLALRTQRTYRRVKTRSPEFQAVHRSIMALRRWIRKFHGVATRYLDHYLAWHRFLELADAWGGPAPGSAGPRHCLLMGRFP